ncbi:hypothetical protein ETAE_2965 [Edwardsiella piscicida]|uniref:Uncharacterized protein n=2 Tax=Edwardsiella TaxID=635 RepID=A0A0H3DTG9_EDWTF|nr:hypothetical protein ETAE_2965 [Edwardsiella tarda EIB202]ADM42796.1 hypothetical protein ETAF_2693 [Edwardsiella tarda FL6-60]
MSFRHGLGSEKVFSHMCSLPSKDGLILLRCTALTLRAVWG